MGPATDHFFELPELIEPLLRLTDTLTLINCMRVCRLWRDVIRTSRHLQEMLFFLPSEGDAELTIFNPMLELHFAPILGPIRPSIFEDGVEIMYAPPCEYDGRSLLSWAKKKEGRIVAFMRKEASWRRMLLCQPPLDLLHHYCRYKTFEMKPPTFRPMHFGGSIRNIEATGNIGMLWDLVEPLLVRGCRAQVYFYYKGGCAQRGLRSSVADRADYMAAPQSVKDRREERRIVLLTDIHWDGCARSGFYLVFDYAKQEWVLPEENPYQSTYDETGGRLSEVPGGIFSFIIDDCEKENERGVVRWSKSAASSWPPAEASSCYSVQT